MAATQPGKAASPITRRPAWPVATKSTVDWSRTAANDSGSEREARARRRWLEYRDRGRLGSACRSLLRSWWRRLSRLNAPIVYPWFAAALADRPESGLHRAAAAQVRSRATGPVAQTWHAFKVATWPLAAAVAAPIVTLRHGGKVWRRFGVNPLRQAADVIRAAGRHGIFPTEFYHRRLFAEPVRANLSAFLAERAMQELNRAVLRGSGASRVDDVLRFFSECRASGFAVPKMLVCFRGGELEFRSGEGPALLPEKDIALFSVSPSGDRARQRWHWNPASRQWNHGGESLGARALFERFRRQSHRGILVVQEAVNNHPEMARFSTGSLVEIRLATLLDGTNDATLLSAALRVPVGGDSVADVAEGLESAIDLETGTLSRARGEFISDDEFDVHPETGAVLAGTGVPYWQDLVALARRAHLQFADTPHLEWRLGVAGTGPVILGASTTWRPFVHETVVNGALTEACLRRLVAAKVRQVQVDAATTALARAA